MLSIVRGILGLLFFIAVAYLFSRDRKAINWRLVGIGMTLQIVFGLLITQVEEIKQGFDAVAEAFVTFLDYGMVGARFLFNDLAKDSSEDPNAAHNMGFIFAFQVLPILIFFSSISAALYYLGVLQRLVYGIAWIMKKSMGLSGPESLSAAGNIFLGQTEAPMLVRPFISKMTKSELMCLMTGGMATLAGSVFAAYISFLGGGDPAMKAQYAAYLLSASVMNAPAGIVIAKMLIPETTTDSSEKKLEVSKEQIGVNLIDATARGAADGLKLALNVGGMLLAFVSVVALLNGLLSGIGGLEWLNLNQRIASSTDGLFDKLSLEYILGQLFRVVAFIMGVSWEDSTAVGSLLGIKTAVNEFLAYLQLAEFRNAQRLEERSVVIATFALAGFANFSSIAIQIGGLGSMAPDRQSDISKLGLLSLLGGTLACLMTGTIAGMLMV